MTPKDQIVRLDEWVRVYSKEHTFCECYHTYLNIAANQEHLSYYDRIL